MSPFLAKEKCPLPNEKPTLPVGARGKPFWGLCQVDEGSSWLPLEVERLRSFCKRTSPHPTPGTPPLAGADGDRTAAGVGLPGRDSVRGRAQLRSVALGRPT